MPWWDSLPIPHSHHLALRGCGSVLRLRTRGAVRHRHHSSKLLRGGAEPCGRTGCVHHVSGKKFKLTLSVIKLLRRTVSAPRSRQCAYPQREKHGFNKFYSIPTTFPTWQVTLILTLKLISICSIYCMLLKQNERTTFDPQLNFSELFLKGLLKILCNMVLL